MLPELKTYNVVVDVNFNFSACIMTGRSLRGVHQVTEGRLARPLVFTNWARREGRNRNHYKGEEMKKYVCVIVDNDSFCSMSFHDELSDLLEEVIERTMGLNSIIECYADYDHITLTFIDEADDEEYTHEIGNSITEVKAWLTEDYFYEDGIKLLSLQKTVKWRIYEIRNIYGISVASNSNTNY